LGIEVGKQTVSEMFAANSRGNLMFTAYLPSSNINIVRAALWSRYEVNTIL
jgi:hypothetical protein